MSRSKNEKQNIGTSRSKNEKQNIGTFLQVRCCFVLDMESNRLGPLGLSFILDKAILMAVSWWNLPNKLRWSRFWWTQTCKPVIAAKDGTNKKWGNWSAKVVRKKATNRVALTWWMMFTRAAKLVILLSSCFSPRLPIGAREQAWYDLSFQEASSVFPVLVIPQELH
jgi:hypothetical protein